MYTKEMVTTKKSSHTQSHRRALSLACVLFLTRCDNRWCHTAVSYTHLDVYKRQVITDGVRQLVCSVIKNFMYEYVHTQR